ncbi:hypothetical protein NC651_009543 [Populus alba x Populus x berolinensis]|nr:hypothetical protein NC651_009543 [Populus alba x Populus x berolinensis]
MVCQTALAITCDNFSVSELAQHFCCSWWNVMLVHRFKIHQLIQLLLFLMLQYIGLLSFNSKFCLQMLLSAPLLVLLLKKEYC